MRALLTPRSLGVILAAGGMQWLLTMAALRALAQARIPGAGQLAAAVILAAALAFAQQTRPVQNAAGAAGVGLLAAALAVPAALASGAGDELAVARAAVVACVIVLTSVVLWLALR